jgi:hypothetical protein
LGSWWMISSHRATHMGRIWRQATGLCGLDRVWNMEQVCRRWQPISPRRAALCTARLSPPKLQTTIDLMASK